MFIFLTINDSISLFFLIVAIVMTLLCLFFYRMNLYFKQKISDLEIEIREILDRKVIKSVANDVVSIQNLSFDGEVEQENVIKNDKENSDLYKRDKECNSLSCHKEENNNLNSNYNKKNSNFVRRDNVQVVDNCYKIEDTNISNLFDKNVKLDNREFGQDSFDLSDFVNKGTRIVPGVKEEDIEDNYLREVSDKMANELQPQTIELTDYEKDQEEHAVISYQELLALRDGIQIQDDEDNTINFIEQLRDFRGHLDR